MNYSRQARNATKAVLRETETERESEWKVKANKEKLLDFWEN